MPKPVKIVTKLVEVDFVEWTCSVCGKQGHGYAQPLAYQLKLSNCEPNQWTNAAIRSHPKDWDCISIQLSNGNHGYRDPTPLNICADEACKRVIEQVLALFPHRS